MSRGTREPAESVASMVPSPPFGIFEVKMELIDFRDWPIERRSKSFSGDAFTEMVERFPARVDCCDGMIGPDHERRMLMLAMLIENVGVDEVIKIGNAELWLEAAQDELGTRRDNEEANERRGRLRENERINRIYRHRLRFKSLVKSNADKHEELESIFANMVSRLGGWPITAQRDGERIMLCSHGDGDLAAGSLYEILGDIDSYGCLRVVDDTGEDYLYPADWFCGIEDEDS